jgi:hypothetical protein
MSTALLMWRSIEATVLSQGWKGSNRAFEQEVFMSSLKSAIAILVNEPARSEAPKVTQTPKPRLVANGAERIDDPVTRHIQTALDYALSNGSMPA